MGTRHTVIDLAPLPGASICIGSSRSGSSADCSCCRSAVFGLRMPIRIGVGFRILDARLTATTIARHCCSPASDYSGVDIGEASHWAPWLRNGQVARGSSRYGVRVFAGAQSCAGHNRSEGRENQIWCCAHAGLQKNHRSCLWLTQWTVPGD